MEKIINRLMESPTGLTSTYRSGPSETDRLALASSSSQLRPALLFVNGPFRESVADTRLVKDFVVLPDLPQPKVNKHLIALVSKKLVTKNNIGVSGSSAMTHDQFLDSILLRGPVDGSAEHAVLCLRAINRLIPNRARSRTSGSARKAQREAGYSNAEWAGADSAVVWLDALTMLVNRLRS